MGALPAPLEDWFGADGLVVATLGTQGGPLCAPVFQYRVLSGDSIELFNQDGTIAFQRASCTRRPSVCIAFSLCASQRCP